MVRRVSPAELQRIMREAQRKQKSAIDAYNRDVRRHNEKVKQQVSAINRDIARHNQEVSRNQARQKSAIDSYNREVRAHNRRVEANRQQALRELQRLNREPIQARYEPVRRSSVSLNEAFNRFATQHSVIDDEREEFLVAELPARENAHSLALANALSGNESPILEDGSTDTQITDELASISPDLDARWKGALFALKPENPDAARHFCTSSREIIAIILNTKAPDEAVLAANPACGKTPKGQPSRRAKIDYLLNKSNIKNDDFASFVDEDMKNVVELFDVFNSATHGEAGKYSLQTLQAIKNRVEGGIFFLTKIAA